MPEENPDHWRLMFPNDYLGAWDLPKDTTVTIDGLELEELVREGGKKEPKWVMRFVGATKRMVLNKTNAGTIASLHGSRTVGWKGKRITLYATTCKFGKDTVECIRVRPTLPPEKK